MLFKVKGRIIAVLPEVKGASAKGEWVKRDFVIEDNDERFPKKICFTLFNSTLNFGINAEVEVSFGIEAKEYQGRWFNNITAFKVELIGVEPLKSTPSEPKEIRNEGDSNDLPF